MKKLIPYLIKILCTAIAVFEYVILLVYWGGDGTFTFVAAPIMFVLYLAIQLYLKRKYKNNAVVSQVLKYSIILLTPIITILTWELFALIFGFDIVIQ